MRTVVVVVDGASSATSSSSLICKQKKYMFLLDVAVQWAKYELEHGSFLLLVSDDD
jgi:hypothetical protein